MSRRSCEGIGAVVGAVDGQITGGDQFVDGVCDQVPVEDGQDVLHIPFPAVRANRAGTRSRPIPDPAAHDTRRRCPGWWRDRHSITERYEIATIGEPFDRKHRAHTES